MTASSATSVSAAVPRAKAEGAFIAHAAGDAFGWPQELRARGRGKQRQQVTSYFRDWERRSGGRFYPHSEMIRAGEYSDDTQLTLAVARSRILAGSGWWAFLTRNELPLWTIYERGGGGATKRAAESWVQGIAPWKQASRISVRKYFEAGGNGVAMRVIPHAVYCACEDDPTNLLRDVFTDGVATHGHPRALVGAAAYAYATWWLMRARHTVRFGELVSVLIESKATWGTVPVGSTTKNSWFETAYKTVGNYDRTWRQVVDEMSALLAQVRDGLEAGSLSDDYQVLEALGAFGSAKGAGTISTAAAVYLSARYAAQPIQGVLRAAFAVGADTDTIAAMTGGLLGALAGAVWFPSEWLGVQDCEYTRQIANRVAARVPKGEALALRCIGPRDLNSIVEALLAGSREEVDFGGTRRVRVMEIGASVPVLPSADVHAWRLCASDGQTLYVTKASKKVKGKAPESSRQVTHIASRRSAPATDTVPKAKVVGTR